MPTKKLQVFISSTYRDLKDERQAAVAAILKAGHIPAGMELFTAGDASQWDVITKWIDESDIYMLIVGGRYGSLHPKQKISYTELEYDYAIQKKKPHFAVVIAESELEARVKRHGPETIEQDEPGKLEAFRAKVLTKMSAFFTDTKDIRLAVHETIPDLDRRHAPKGWVSGAELVDNRFLVDEVSRLTKENNRLQEELNTATEKIKKSKQNPIDADYEELTNTLSLIQLNTKLIREGTSLDKEISLLAALYLFRDALVAGVVNSPTMTDRAKFLFFQVCTKLETYGLAETEKAGNNSYRLYKLNQQGRRILSLYEREILSKKAAT